MRKAIHDIAGGIAGGVSALAKVQNQGQTSAAAQAIGGIAAGVLASRLPDMLEPATNPNHRRTAHSITVATALAELNRFFTKQAELCQASGAGARQRMESTESSWERAWLWIEWVICQLVAGALNGLVPGYWSHLALDALTPKRLPIV